MNRMPVVTVLIGLACLLGTAGCVSKNAAMQPKSDEAPVSAATPTPTESVSNPNSHSLKACLAKIPSDSSVGMILIAEQTCRDNEALHQQVIGTATAKSGGRVSSGTQGDSLEYCLARIPSDATVGQRLLAEESCKRDQLTHH